MLPAPVTAAHPTSGPWPKRLETIAESGAVVPALFALTLGLRLAFATIRPQTPFSDGAWYLARAGELAAGMGYQEAGHPTAFWPVGFPALLAGGIRLAGNPTAAMLVVNLGGAAAMLALILWFARQVGTPPLGTRIAGLLYALYPASIVYAGAPLSETSSTAVSMVAFALLIAGMRRWPLLVLAGLVFGAATLMRAQMLLFPLGAVVAIALVDRSLGWRQPVRALVLVYLAIAATLLPWTLRNERMLGAPVPVSTNGGMSLFTGANDRATGDWFAWEHTPLWDESGIPFSQRVERQVELDRRFKTLSEDWIVAHPVRWTVLGLKKAALVWRKDSDAFWSMHESYPTEERAWTLVALADQLYYFALLALALPALILGVRGIVRRDARAKLALLCVMPAFVTLTAFAFTGQIRYHYPAMPFVVVAAGWTLATWINRRSGYDRPAA